MTHPLAAEARRLRIEEELSIREIRERLGVGKDLLYELLRGVPPPEWTRRPNAKDDVRARAVEMRGDGWTVNDIALELGVSKSTAHRWVGRLKERDLMLAGAVAYWCEGAKSKPWRKQTGLDFANSNPGLVKLFVRFVKALGVSPERLVYRVSIHESADAEAATRWWADQIGVPREIMRRPTLKRHNPVTVRHNTGEEYHGCMIIKVPRSRLLYVRVEGIMAGLFEALVPK